MGVKRGGGTLSNAKGADVLATLGAKLAQLGEPSPPAKDVTVEEDLQLAILRNPPLPPQMAPVSRGQNSKSKKEIIRIADPALRQRMRAELRAIMRAEVSPPVPKALVSDMGEAAFRRIIAMRDRLDRFNASHLAPTDAPPDTRQTIERRVSRGADRVSDIIDPDNGYYIGHDFGTSTTKAVLRLLYQNSVAAFAVAVPRGWASGGQPHLWPTALWYDSTGESFSPVPRPGWTCLQGFKSALIEGQGHRTCCGTSVLMREAAAAFLAIHVAYVIGAALEEQSDLRIGGINVGAPVTVLTGVKGKGGFDDVAQTALSLVPFASALTRRDVETTFARNPEPVIPYQLHTELSGAIAGYCRAPRHYLGGHIIIDCGSATLDIASFHLGTDDWPIGIYSARVEPLGADACLAYQQHDATAEECRSAARFHEHQVYRDTLSRERLRFQQDNGKFPYQLILIGGGVHGAVHKPLLDGMENAFHRPFHRPMLAQDLRYDLETEPGRLVLADGLARDPVDLRKVAIPLDQAPAPTHCQPEVITKDQV